MTVKSAVVIGSGLGGLAAGIALAQKGVFVTVLEKQQRPGGYSTSFARQGYRFDVALHAVPAGGRGEYFERLLAFLGCANDVSFVKYAHPYQMRVGSSRFDIPSGYEAFFDSCGRYFPHEKNGLGRFRAYLSRHASVYSDLLEGRENHFTAVARFLPNIPDFLRNTTLSTDAFLSHFFHDPTLKALVYQPAIFPGIPMRRLPAINFIMMFGMLVGTGMYTIAGGGQSLTDALVNRFVRLGGRLRTGEEAVSIEVTNGRASAVTTRSGGRDTADAVVANVNIPYLVDELVGRRHFPAAFCSQLSRLIPSLSVLQLHAGLDCPCDTVGIDHNITMTFPDSGIDSYMEKQSKSPYPDIISCIVPDLSKPQPVASVVCGTGGMQWFSLPEKEYKESKAAMADCILKRLDGLFPSFSPHCRVINLSTPRTFYRYTGNPAGAILGFDCSIGMHRHMRAISRLPIKNIHIASAWSDCLGGYMQTIKCGIRAAERICAS